MQAADILLERLLASYRREHGQYFEHKRNLRTLVSLGIIAVIAAPFIFAVCYLTEGPRILALIPEALLSAFALPLLLLAGIIYRIGQSRKALRRLKKELDNIGYFVAYDTRQQYDRPLILLDSLPEDEVVKVIPRWEEIDFRTYDEAFKR